MKKFCLVLCLILTLSEDIASGETNSFWNETNVSKLKAGLLKNYDRFSRPDNNDTPTNLTIGVTIIHMDLDETRGVLTTHAWVNMRWNDGKLKWDPKENDNITLIHFAADEIWQPDLSVYNSAEPTVIDHFAKSNKLAYDTGSILWVPTAKFETYCFLNLKFWPFDKQTCSIKLGSWTYNAFQINLFLNNDSPVDRSHYNDQQWELLETKAVRNELIYACCPEPYPDITFTMTLRRAAPMFKAIAIVPASVIVFMILTAFWLPPQSGEKLLLNGLSCVIICILLMYFSQLLPIFSSGTPMIVTFYSQTLYLLCISFIISVVVINISRNHKSFAVPKLLKTVFLDSFIGLVFGGKQSDPASAEQQLEEVKGTQSEVTHTSGDHHIAHASASSTQNDWIRLAIVIDRLAFVIYIIAFILMGFLHFV